MVTRQRWLALPDTPRPWSRVAEVMTGCEVVPHASGRPWLLGSWRPGEITVARTGSTVVAVLGTTPSTATWAAELAGRVGRGDDPDGVLRAVPGCAHVLISAGGAVRVQGTLSGLRQVFHTRVDGLVVASDRADVLARVTGAGIDEDLLATRVVCRGVMLPPPLAQRPLWREVRAVAPDHYLHIDADGTTGRSIRRWTPPSPELSLAEGAPRLRQALVEAVAARRPGDGAWGSDLSGGQDSTSLCFLAAHTNPGRGGRGLVTYRWGEAEAGNDDAVFAARATTALPCARHVVEAQRDLPALFTDPQRPGDLESPYLFSRTLARTVHTAATLAGHGIRVHLAGHGGDELFHEPPGYLHDLRRTRPRLALTHLRGFRALGRWPWPATLAALADRRGLDAWWREQADQLTQPPPSHYAPACLSWGHPLRAPAWVTPAAVEAAQRVLRATAEHVQPLAPQRGQHTTLATIATTGPAYRQLARVFADAGVCLEMPFLDDTVIDTALAVRPEQRRTPWRYRPLQAEALRGIVPPDITGRCTKAEFGQDLRDGLAANTAAVLDTFADSTLAAAGLIDPGRLRDRLLAPHADNTAIFALEDLLGCENWLRATTSTAEPATATVTGEDRRTDGPVPAP